MEKHYKVTILIGYSTIVFDFYATESSYVEIDGKSLAEKLGGSYISKVIVE